MLAGRYVEIRVYPLDFREYLDFAAENPEESSLSQQEQFANFLRFGGLPGIHQMKWEETRVMQYLHDIYNSVLLKDVIARNKIRDTALLESVIAYLMDNIGNTFSAKTITDFLKNQGRKLSAETVYNYLRALESVYRIDGVKRNPEKMRFLLRSLARNESTTVTNKTLVNGIRAADEEELDGNTVSAYLNVFERLFLLENQPPFSVGIRSSVRVKQAEKRHFVDPSLACALLHATPDGLMGDLNTLGFLFEALCERDLRIYCETFGGRLYHYQDYQGKEIDAVIELSDGKWCGFEIKLGANQIEAAAKSLLDLNRQISQDPKGKPANILCVVCGLATAAYQRADGVYVVPITALRN